MHHYFIVHLVYILHDLVYNLNMIGLFLFFKFYLSSSEVFFLSSHLSGSFLLVLLNQLLPTLLFFNLAASSAPPTTLPGDELSDPLVISPADDHKLKLVFLVLLNSVSTIISDALVFNSMLYLDAVVTYVKLGFKAPIHYVATWTPNLLLLFSASWSYLSDYLWCWFYITYFCVNSFAKVLGKGWLVYFSRMTYLHSFIYQCVNKSLVLIKVTVRMRILRFCFFFVGSFCGDSCLHVNLGTTAVKFSFKSKV
jgi:hypothetical protein